MNFPLFIAKRLYSDQGDKRKVSRPAIHIATAGVAIGLAIMVMSVCVVLGFKHTIRDKVIGFGSHIQVADFMTLQQQNQYPVVMNDSMVKVLQKIPGVKHVQRFAMKEGILKTDNDFLGVVLKGVGPAFFSHLFRNSLKFFLFSNDFLCSICRKHLHLLFLGSSFHNGACIAGNGDPYYQDTADNDPHPSNFHIFTSLSVIYGLLLPAVIIFQSYSTIKSDACEYYSKRSNIL